MEISAYHEKDLASVASQLVEAFAQVKVWCFDAGMGAGKTTLIKEICRQMGVSDEMSSPTFAIVNEYHTKNDTALYHFDCYRLEDEEEAINIGVEDYFFSNNYCFIEWPGIISSFLPDEYLKIRINLVGDNARSLVAGLD